MVKIEQVNKEKILVLKIWNYNQVHFHWSITGVIPKRARIIWKTAEVGGMLERSPPVPSNFFVTVNLHLRY